MPRRGQGWQQRERIAQTAARIMFDQGVRDFQLAKQKAALQLGIARNSSNMPRNREIEEALREYQRLFHAPRQREALVAQRQAALAAMELLADFQPRLTGPVLRGSATPHSPVTLLLSADAPEQVAMRLMDTRVNYQESERQLRLEGRAQGFACYRFDLGEITVEAIVLGPESYRQSPPASPVDGRPAERAGPTQLARLLAAEAPAEPLPALGSGPRR
ncbi:MAG: hypothetical protein SV108_00625 [Pseudomonadota bacterium]|nr:hypothetical protein [Pseudomonadota bacterium]